MKSKLTMQDIRELREELERSLGQGPVIVSNEQVTNALRAIEALVKVVRVGKSWVDGGCFIGKSERELAEALRDFQASEFAGLLEPHGVTTRSKFQEPPVESMKA